MGNLYISPLSFSLSLSPLCILLLLTQRTHFCTIASCLLLSLSPFDTFSSDFIPHPSHPVPTSFLRKSHKQLMPMVRLHLLRPTSFVPFLALPLCTPQEIVTPTNESIFRTCSSNIPVCVLVLVQVAEKLHIVECC